MKARILFVTKTRSFGGCEKHLVDFIASLDTSCTECIVLCMEDDVYSPRLECLDHVIVLKVSTGCQPGLLSYLLLFRRNDADVVLFVNGELGLFPWYAYLAARLNRSRRVFAIEQLIAASPGKVTGAGLWNALRRQIGHYARVQWRIKLASWLIHKTIVVSDAVGDKLVQEYGYSSANIITIRNGVDLRRFARSRSTSLINKKAELGLTASDFIVLCISSLDPRKRIDVLLNAFRLVGSHCPNAKCVILGRGPLESELRSRADELGLANSVIFKGHVADVRPYLEVSALFVLTSDREGLPLSICEAMAYGIPCIATDVGGNKEVIIQGQTGLLIEPGSSEQLAEAIEYLVAHPEDLRRMGENSLLRIQQHFNSVHLMEELQQVLLGGLEVEADQRTAPSGCNLLHFIWAGLLCISFTNW